MKIKDKEAWKEYVEKNKDSYGKACVDYARSWANLMQREIKKHPEMDINIFMGKYALCLSHKADTDGITGFMYGCAVSMLSRCWFYGEELRRWHNLDTQIQKEGEKANKSGGVLNPALLNLG